MNELHKPFAIFQNDNTGRSWIWLEDENRWSEASAEEFIALQTLAEYLRLSDDPMQVLKNTLEAAEDSDEENDDFEPFQVDLN